MQVEAEQQTVILINMKKDYIRDINNDAQRRFMVTDVTIEQRAAEVEGGEGTEVIKGYFSVYDSNYKLWNNTYERIAKGALDGADISDVLCLYNHEDEMLLGRLYNGEGTLKIGIDERGGYFTCEKANTTAFNDTYENIRLKNIRGCSFAFTIESETVETDVPQADGSMATIYTINKIKKLYDVGPVNNPAYIETDVEASMRSRVQPIKKEVRSQQDLLLISRINKTTNK